MKILKKLSILVLAFSPAIGVYLLFANSQNIVDWWRLQSYEPSDAIVSLADTSSFNTQGRKLFYIYDPGFLKKEDFAGKCQIDEATIVLGCYVNSNKIYVLDVEDDRLAGVEQVTAAHEMLHAAYDRLSSQEKKDIDAELGAVFASIKDQRLISTIEDYQARDPSLVPNELHSIIGTEVANLPVSLEQYYSKYFIDRQSVVKKSEAYEGEFTKRENQIKEYDSQLAKLKEKLDSQELYLQALQQDLQLESDNLNSKRDNPQQFNSLVDSYNAKVKQYNSLVNKAKKLTEEYNSIVELRNLIAVQQQELLSAIDTRLLETQ